MKPIYVIYLLVTFAFLSIFSCTKNISGHNTLYSNEYYDDDDDYDDYDDEEEEDEYSKAYKAKGYYQYKGYYQVCFYWVDTIHLDNPVILETLTNQYFILPREYANLLSYDATEEDVLRCPKAAVFYWDMEIGFLMNRHPSKWEAYGLFPWREFNFFTTLYPHFPKREFSKHFQEVLVDTPPDIYYIYLVRGFLFNHITCFADIEGSHRHPVEFPDKYAFYRLCIPGWRYPGPGPKYERRKEK